MVVLVVAKFRVPNSVIAFTSMSFDGAILFSDMGNGCVCSNGFTGGGVVKFIPNAELLNG